MFFVSDLSSAQVGAALQARLDCDQLSVYTHLTVIPHCYDAWSLEGSAAVADDRQLYCF